jgi:hypothetical protein
MTWFKVTPQERLSKELALLRKSKRQIIRQQKELSLDKPQDFKNLSGLFKGMVQKLKNFAPPFLAAFEKINENKTRSKLHYRQMQAEHGLTREAYQPDTLKTVLIIQACIIVEGLLTAGIMLSDGKMDVIGGLSYGFSVAGINIATGVIAGFFALRWANWKNNSEFQTKRDYIIRLFARMAFAAFLSVMAVLHYAAARVRATGSSSDIFDFSEIGFFAPFNDYYAIAIIVAGTLGGILAIYEGYQGLSDKVPTYTKARKEAEESYDGQAENLYEKALDQLDRLYFESRHKIEDIEQTQEQVFLDYQNACIALNDATLDHNNAIDDAMDRVRSFEAKNLKMLQFFVQKKIENAPIDYEAFEHLRLDEVSIPQTSDLSTLECDQPTALLNELDTAYDQAAAAIDAAYQEVLNNQPVFNLDEE